MRARPRGTTAASRTDRTKAILAPEIGEAPRALATFAPDRSVLLGFPAEFSARSVGAPATGGSEDAGLQREARRQLEAGCAAAAAREAFEAVEAAEALEALEATTALPPPPSGGR